MSENTIPSAEANRPAVSWPLAQWLPLILLALAHLPLLWKEYRSLWDKEHYQFFPLALISFAVYFRARRLPNAFSWRPVCWALIAADVLLLCYSSGVSGLIPGTEIGVSPIGGTTGFWLLVWAICLACADREAKSSLGYLMILPLITVRPPLNYDLSLILWLQGVTTSIASELLNFFNFLHVQTGVILEFPGKRFQVADACSGVQSLYAVLFLAAFVTCGYRRRFFHTLVVIASGLLFAAVMNVLRIAAIAIAWETSRTDLTSGLAHDVIGYIALFAAAMLVFSADAFLAFCFDPVPDQKGAGITAIYRNPFVSLWNWLFLVTARKDDPKVESKGLPPRLLAATSAGAGIVCAMCLFLQARILELF